MTENSLGFNKPPNETRVVVAMSGGVDSSVVAAILKQEGYDVIGITLQLYDNGAYSAKSGTCCAGQDIDDARRVCEKLNIQHYVLNYEKRFYDNVINPFIDSYISGETPVPCITCNQTVKFNDLLKAAQKLGADALATGHYLRNIKLGDKRALYRPKDLDRDQSYFLFTTTQEQINYLRFPLGDMPKSEVRNIAANIGLDIAAKPDSQDICFVAAGKYTDLINKKNTKPKEGKIIHINGTILGKHNGVFHYTIGQRRGINISYKEPIYVIKIDAVTNRIIVGNKEALLTHRITLRNVNWLGDVPISSISNGIELYAKVRSTREPCRAILYYKDNETIVDFPDGEDSVAPGQACVFFSDNTQSARLLGGGFIKKCTRAEWAEELLKNLV